MSEEDKCGETCLCCKFMYFSPGSPGYSELTPGTGADFHCGKNHWYFWEWDGFEIKGTKGKYIGMYEAFQTAKTCPDFEHR